MIGAARARITQSTSTASAAIARGERRIGRGRTVSSRDFFFLRPTTTGLAMGALVVCTSAHPDTRVDEGISDIDQQID